MLWFKHPDAVKPNLALLSYLTLAYPLAWYGLSQPAWFAPSLLLMVNVLVLSAYLLHDCLHNSVFASPANNERLGTQLARLVGAVYSPYAALRDKHFRHHIERADILAVLRIRFSPVMTFITACWARNTSRRATGSMKRAISTETCCSSRRYRQVHGRRGRVVSGGRMTIHQDQLRDTPRARRFQPPGDGVMPAAVV